MSNGVSQSNKLLSELLKCEINVWDALVAGDQKADANALDDRFLGVYPDGFSGKDGHVGQLANGPTIESYELSDHRILELGDKHAALSYRASFTRRTGTEPEAMPESMYVSSIWKRRDDGWINIFSQDTPAID